MSVSEAERFVGDVQKDKQLAQRLKAHAAGLAALTAGAKAQGYNFTVDELKQVMRAKAKQNLDDAQLDAIAGGGGQQPSIQVAANVQAVAINNVQAVVIDVVQTQVISQATAIIMAT